MANVRLVDFLGSVGAFRVLGQGKAAETCVKILSSLGASVEHEWEWPELALTAAVASDDIVICDLVESGSTDSYCRAVGERRRCVWVTISAFGLDGPLGGRRGSDLVCSAAGGLLGAVADDEGLSYHVPGNQALQLGGQMAVLAALHGISLAKESSRSVHLDVSVQEAVAFCSVQQEVAHLLYQCTGRAGTGRYSSPSGRFPCTDGNIEILVLDDEQWRRTSVALGRETWTSDYPTITDRQTNRTTIDAAVAEWTRVRSKLECEAILQEAGVPAVAVRTLEEVARLQQFRERGFLLNESSSALSTNGLPASIEVGDSSPVDARRDVGLDALRVVEATGVLAGPLAGAMLGAMGATVVRLENSARLDIYRRNGPFMGGVPNPEGAAYFSAANYCKLGVQHDFESDKAYARRIRDWGDLLLENVGERVLNRFGLGDDRNHADGGASVLSISGFGRTGPAAHFKAYAGNVHAFAGLDRVVDWISGSEARVRCAYADYCTAVWGATLAAAWWLGSGKPHGMDLSMAEVVAERLNGVALGIEKGTAEEPHEELLIRCADGREIAVTAVSTVEVAQLLDFIGVKEGELQQPRGDGVRVVELRGVPDPPASAEVLARIARAEVSAASYLVQRVEEITTDEQLSFRGFVVELEHPKVGWAQVLALPWKAAFAQRSGYRRAPLLGEHNQVMRELLLEEVAVGEPLDT